MKEVVFATKNKGKIKEIQAILGNEYIVKSMEEIGINIDIIEDGKTFEENAIKKAVEIMNITNKIVFFILLFPSLTAPVPHETKRRLF